LKKRKIGRPRGNEADGKNPKPKRRETSLKKKNESTTISRAKRERVNLTKNQGFTKRKKKGKGEGRKTMFIEVTKGSNMMARKYQVGGREKIAQKSDDKRQGRGFVQRHRWEGGKGCRKGKSQEK